MNRRDFLAASAITAIATKLPAQPHPVKPMEVGLKINIDANPEVPIARVRKMGFNNTFFSLDSLLGKYTPALARQLAGLLAKYSLTCTAAEVVGPGRLTWDFTDGPSTIGLVPPATRAARIDALKQTSDFAKLLNIPSIQTHCGFIPENPRDPLYPQTVAAITEVAKHCAANGQRFLMETGQETPVTILRTIKDVAQPNLGVGLDTANLIMYGKATPTEAVNLIGPWVHSIHAKDATWPTNPVDLGNEVLIGTGVVDFKSVFAKLKQFGYTGAVSIERETSGPQQIADVAKEKIYLENVIRQI